jgi:hypothetical protein
MKSKMILATALLTMGAAGSALAITNPYPGSGSQNTATYSFTANGGDVTAYFLGTSASYTEDLGLLVNGVDSGITGLDNHSSAVGASLDFGSIAAGSTLTFYINVANTGATWYSDKSLNSDGAQHIFSTTWAGGPGSIPAGTYVGFEDLAASVSDFNYLDEPFVFTNVVSTPAVPEPGNIALLMAGLGVFGVLARRRARL